MTMGMVLPTRLIRMLNTGIVKNVTKEIGTRISIDRKGVGG